MFGMPTWHLLSTPALVTRPSNSTTVLHKDTFVSWHQMMLTLFQVLDQHHTQSCPDPARPSHRSSIACQSCAACSCQPASLTSQLFCSAAAPGEARTCGLTNTPTHARARRLINLHIISTLGVPTDKVAPCIECWCRDEGHLSQGRFGGGFCCDSALCPSELPDSLETTYVLQYNTTYRWA